MPAEVEFPPMNGTFSRWATFCIAIVTVLDMPPVQNWMLSR